MALKAILESLDDVPEALHEQYRQQKVRDKDGAEKEVWVLQVDGLEGNAAIPHPVIRNLVSAHERTKADKQRLTTRVQELETKVDGLPDDFDPEEYSRLKALEADAEANKGKKAEEKLEFENVKRMLEERHTKKVGELEKQIDELKRKVLSQVERNHDLIKATQLDRALDDAGIKADDRELVRDHLAPKIKVEVDEGDSDEHGEVRLVIDDTPLKEWVIAWSQSDKGRRYVEPLRGSDAAPGKGKVTGDNPWGDKSWNLTKQQDMIASNPERAAQLRTAAGYNSQDEATRLGGAKHRQAKTAPAMAVR